MIKAHSKKSFGEVRIIGGQWKRTPLQVTSAEGLRPTPNRVRETLFNWLGQNLKGWHCLDAFAGTGALGFEAASRGADVVWMHEIQPEALRQLKQNIDKLKAHQVHLIASDGLKGLADQAHHSLDLIFLDPPFESHLLNLALPLAAKVIRASGWIYLESAHPLDSTQIEPLGLSIHRQLRAGMVHAHLLQAIA